MSHLGLTCPNPTWRNHHVYFQKWLRIRLPQKENGGCHQPNVARNAKKKMTFRWQEVQSDKGASFDLLQAPLKDMPIKKKKNHEQIQG